MVVADGPLTSFAEGVWVGTEPVRFLGLQLTATMAVLRLGDESLLLYSPVAMTPERRAAVEALGPVAHLCAKLVPSPPDRRVGRGLPLGPAARPSGLGQEAP